MTDRELGFIGMGNMGGRITRRLVDAGIMVVGFDAKPGLASSAGATEAATIAEVVDATDIIMMSLPDSKVVESVTTGTGGVLEHCRAGQAVVDLSTSAPASTIRLGALFAERDVSYLDAGISGGAAAAENGALTLMVGGSSAVLARLGWAFEPFSSKLVHMGRTGSGHSTKLLNNFLNAVSLAATAEMMVAGKQAGLDLGKVLDVVNNSSGVNFATLNRFPRIIEGDYLEGGLSGRLMTKDVALYVDHLRELGVPCLNAAGPLATFGLGENLGYGEQISNRVVDAIGDLAGGVRLHDEQRTGG